MDTVARRTTLEKQRGIVCIHRTEKTIEGTLLEYANDKLLHKLSDLQHKLDDLAEEYFPRIYCAFNKCAQLFLFALFAPILKNL